MTLSALEQKIIEEGRKVRAIAHKGALEARKANLKAELDRIESDLKELVQDEPVPAPEPAEPVAPAKKASAPKQAAAEAKKPADGAAEAT